MHGHPLPGKPRRPVIPAVWFALRPGKPVAFWLRVSQEARRRKISKSDLLRIRQLAWEMK